MFSLHFTGIFKHIGMDTIRF